MVCPCRVVLAGLSAFVAVFLIWHVKSTSVGQDEAKSGDEVGLLVIARLRRARCLATSNCLAQLPCWSMFQSGVWNAVQTNKARGRSCGDSRSIPASSPSWKLVLDMFTGKYLWDVSTAYREQQCKDSGTKVP